MLDFRQNIAERQRRWIAPVLLAGVALGTSSCLFQKKPAKVFSPPPIAAKVPPDTTPVVLPEPPASSTEVGPGEEISVETAGLPLPPAPPKAPAPPKQTTRPPATAPSVANVEPPAPAAPKPVQIYTAEERREFNRELDDSLGRVRQALARVENRSLNAEQRNIVNRIKTFQQQAEQERDQDLVGAVSLARRADSLARDLLSRLP